MTKSYWVASPNHVFSSYFGECDTADEAIALGKYTFKEKVFYIAEGTEIDEYPYHFCIDSTTVQIITPS